MDANVARELTYVAGAVAAVVRLVYLNLVRRFPALFAYLVFLAAINLGFGLMNWKSALYFWSYITLEPLKCVLGIVAVRELFSLAFENYPGIRSGGRWVMYVGIALGQVISLLLTGFFWSGSASGRAHSHLYYFEVSQRSIVFTLAVVIVAILVFLSKYPLHLSRDTMVSSAFFSALFLSEALQLFVDSLAPKLRNNYVDWAESLFMFVCLVGWAAMLRPETDHAPVQVRFSSPHEDQLLEQLNALNQLMTRVARR